MCRDACFFRISHEFCPPKKRPTYFWSVVFEQRSWMVLFPFSRMAWTLHLQGSEFISTSCASK